MSRAVCQWRDDGWLANVRHCPSPNCDDRPDTASVELVVVHAISLPPDEFGGPGVEQLFTNRLVATEHPYFARICELKVSAHFFIRRDGEVLQFVSTDRRAWHAGVSSWEGRECCNDFSVGIELEGCDTRPFADCQYRELARLIALLRERHAIKDVVGHADIAPGRKTDPGPCFEWPRLALLLAEHIDGGDLGRRDAVLDFGASKDAVVVSMQRRIKPVEDG